MKLTPKTEKEIKEAGLLQPGDYPFTVLASDEVPSKSENNKGKLMFWLKLAVHVGDSDRFIEDRFADWFGVVGAMKIRHFCYATGLDANYEAGEVDAKNNAWNGRTGYCRVKIGKSKNPDFPDKNEIADYFAEMPKKKGETTAAPLPASPIAEDDVPF